MTLFEFQGRNFYIDEGLRKSFDKKIIPALKHKDKDVVFCVDGKERSGKSVFSQGISAYLASKLETKCDLSNICLEPVEFRDRVMRAKKREVIIYDEAHRGMGSSSSLSELNKILKDLMMEMGQKNLCVIIVLPTFFLLERYQAIFRTRGLFHVYERKGQRGFWVYYNEKNKQKLYLKGRKELNYNCMKFPRFRGRFLNNYLVDEDAYRAKKAQVFKKKARITKAEVLLEQRNRLLYFISKTLEISSKKLREVLAAQGVALDDSSIRKIIAGLEMEKKDNIGIGSEKNNI